MCENEILVSKETLNEIMRCIEGLTSNTIDRLAILLGIKDNSYQPLSSKASKANFIGEKIIANPLLQKKVLNFIINELPNRKKSGLNNQSNSLNDKFDLDDESGLDDEDENIDNVFVKEYPRLSNALKRDGYVIKDGKIVRNFPEELQQVHTESELMQLLNKFNFNTSMEHLRQAIDNHTEGNWAAANSQFRSFLESLLQEIAHKLDNNKTCNNFNEAIQYLSSKNFLSTKLNEVYESASKRDGYVRSLWNRLQAEGSHPGLSDEADSTFRYHTLIVFARYLLKRLEETLNKTSL